MYRPIACQASHHTRQAKWFLPVPHVIQLRHLLALPCLPSLAWREIFVAHSLAERLETVRKLKQNEAYTAYWQRIVRVFRIVLFLSVIIMVTCSPAQPDTQKPEKNQLSVSGFLVPKTPREVLINIKHAIDKGYFLQNKFFSCDFLRFIIGEYENYPRKGDKQNETSMVLLYNTVETYSYESCIKNGLLGWGIWQECNKYNQQSCIKDIYGNFTATININEVTREPKNEQCGKFSIDLVVELFGQPSEIKYIELPDMPNPHVIIRWLGKRTHKFGASNIFYRYRRNKVDVEIKYIVFGNGVINSFSVHTETRESNNVRSND
ncbi:MAG: hypothetical protein HQM05_17255 [Magnetococcales bacterium]|nr:hypothetical protein [Magnetococcales bacterium]